MEYVESTPPVRTGFLRRFVGAATFKIPIYEEVEHDRAATSQAAGVVGLVALSAALGGLDLASGDLLAGGAIASLRSLMAGVLSAYLGWALWSGTCYLVGVQLFEGTADWGELLRTIGFAQAPGILLMLGLLPEASTYFVLGVYVWMVATVLVAIRQALDFTTGRAFATALAGFVPYVLARTAIEFLLGVSPSILP